MDSDTPRADLQQGDLCYVGDHHVGIYVGGDRVIEAAAHSRGVVESGMGKWNTFGRILPAAIPPAGP